jgi:hypothetical protein
MTIVGSKRMIVYDDVVQQEKIKIFDARVERPPHYDTFAEFHYAYHYGDVYVPYIKQEEPLKIECQHFLDCIRHGTAPLTSGSRGLELVQILEASSESLRRGGGPVELTSKPYTNGHTNGVNGTNGNGNGANGTTADLAVKVAFTPPAAAPAKKRTPRGGTPKLEVSGR